MATISAMSETPSYGEIPAPPGLRDRVACLWRFRQADAPASPVRILPDGHVDLIWDGRALFVAGPDTAAAMADVEAGVVLTGMRLAPGVGANLLGLPLHHLANRRVALAELWGTRANRAGDALAEGRNPQAALLALCDGVVVDRRMQQLFRFLQTEEAARVTGLAAALGFSERSLRRRCQDAFGYGAKTLDRILRLQRFLKLAPHHPGLTAAALAAGYGDAQHLARDTQQLVGLSPRALLAGHGR
ncbi:AraC-type DNA-binding protein [Dyella marensis]|uniref:AraC-type DNA-binding protein n=1 Tax=Dyella marensis TaxID=500610 RepID=A0A1I1XFC2_9GAMM|nr:AraC-type DNA-binding protein [Dyella marensis]